MPAVRKGGWSLRVKRAPPPEKLSHQKQDGEDHHDQAPGGHRDLGPFPDPLFSTSPLSPSGLFRTALNHIRLFRADANFARADTKPYSHGKRICRQS
jgi:hypothetical protein